MKWSWSLNYLHCLPVDTELGESLERDCGCTAATGAAPDQPTPRRTRVLMGNRSERCLIYVTLRLISGPPGRPLDNSRQKVDIRVPQAR